MELGERYELVILIGVTYYPIFRSPGYQYVPTVLVCLGLYGSFSGIFGLYTIFLVTK